MLEAVWTCLVLAVIDGDTFTARCQTWPQYYVETSIRIVGIDTPELRGRCEKEKKLAAEARNVLAELLPLQQSVLLSHVEPDKYGGRFLASVRTADGVDVGGELLKRGLAVSYSGKGMKHDFCKTMKPE